MDKQTIAARIRALLAKTVENGATEAEAMAAAEKARELMDRYQIDAGVADLEAEEVIKAEGDYDVFAARLNIKSYLANSVAEFADCRNWTSTRRGFNGTERKQIFFGLRSDVEFAEWLLSALANFVRVHTAGHVMGLTGATHPKQRHMIARSFALGCIVRIRERLDEATAERKRQGATVAGTGRALVVVKGALVDVAFKKLGIKLGNSHSRRGFGVDGAAYGAGQAAGNSAGFGRPVNGNGRVALIGR